MTRKFEVFGGSSRTPKPANPSPLANRTETKFVASISTEKRVWPDAHAAKQIVEPEVGQVRSTISRIAVHAKPRVPSEFRGETSEWPS